MRVVCTAVRELPPDWSQEAIPRDLFEPFVTVAGTKVTATARGCGAEFDVDVPDGDPGLTHTWDVKTDANGNAVERHKSIECPRCGKFTFLVEAI